MDGSRLILYPELVSAFEAIDSALTASRPTCNLSLAGTRINVRFGCDGLSQPFLRALEFAIEVGNPTAEWVVDVLDERSAPEDLLTRFNPTKPDTAFVQNLDYLSYRQKVPPRFNILDLKRKRAIFFVHNSHLIPWYETCKPFSVILHWILRQSGSLVSHAACVGQNESGVLIIGESGSGKSTLALSAASHGFQFVSDDMTVLSGTTSLHARRIYSAAKLAHFQVLPDLESTVSNRDRKAGEKAIIFVDKAFPGGFVDGMSVRALLLPVIVPGPDSRLLPLSFHEAVRIVFGSTCPFFPGMTIEHFFCYYSWFRHLPAYTLEVGNRSESALSLISKLCTR